MLKYSIPLVQEGQYDGQRHIFLDHIQFTFDNYFSGDNLLYTLGED